MKIFNHWKILFALLPIIGSLQAHGSGWGTWRTPLDAVNDCCAAANERWQACGTNSSLVVTNASTLAAAMDNLLTLSWLDMTKASGGTFNGWFSEVIATTTNYYPDTDTTEIVPSTRQDFPVMTRSNFWEQTGVGTVFTGVYQNAYCFSIGALASNTVLSRLVCAGPTNARSWHQGEYNSFFGGTFDFGGRVRIVSQPEVLVVEGSTNPIIVAGVTNTAALPETLHITIQGQIFFVSNEFDTVQGNVYGVATQTVDVTTTGRISLAHQFVGITHFDVMPTNYSRAGVSLAVMLTQTGMVYAQAMPLSYGFRKTFEEYKAVLNLMQSTPGNFEYSNKFASVTNGYNADGSCAFPPFSYSNTTFLVPYLSFANDCATYSSDPSADNFRFDEVSQYADFVVTFDPVYTNASASLTRYEEILAPGGYDYDATDGHTHQYAHCVWNAGVSGKTYLQSVATATKAAADKFVTFPGAPISVDTSAIVLSFDFTGPPAMRLEHTSFGTYLTERIQHDWNFSFGP